MVDELWLTTDLPEIGLPWRYLEANMYFLSQTNLARAYIVYGLTGWATNVEVENPRNKAHIETLEEDDAERFATMFRRIVAHIEMLGGYHALYSTMKLLAEHSGAHGPEAKGPGHLLNWTARRKRVALADGSAEDAYIVGLHSKEAHHARLAGRILLEMLHTGCSHEQALKTVGTSKSEDLGVFDIVPSGGNFRQLRSIWKSYKSAAHLHAAEALLRGTRPTLAQLLACAEKIREWALTYQRRTSTTPLIKPADLARVPCRWLEYLPPVHLSPGPPNAILEFRGEPCPSRG